MRNFLSLLTVLTFCLCGFMMTSCLDDERVDPPTELDATVTIVDSTIVLVNNDNITISEALVVLEKPTGEILNGAPVTLPYLIQGYNLTAGATDTIPFSNFERENGSQAYPGDVSPLLFRLDFSNGNLTGFIEERF